MLSLLDILSILLTLLILSLVVAEQADFSVGSVAEFAPPVSIIIPTRGLDEDYAENVRSFREVRYPTRPEIIYVTDPDDQPTKTALQGLGCHVVTAEPTQGGAGGKVQAQLTGLKGATGEVIVFADSDIAVGEQWLEELVHPLGSHESVTTFPWPRPKSASVANALRAGFWITGYDAHPSMRGFLWGGSMAFRRSTLNEEFVGFLSTKIYDDLALAEYLKRKRGRLCFNGRARCYNSFEETRFLDWALRQVLVVRKHTPAVASIYFVTSVSILATSVLGVATGAWLGLLPLLAWWSKGFLVSLRMRSPSLLIPLASIPALFVSGFLILISVGRHTVRWRGHEYAI
jgi:ceramide glucosyltransferase